LLFDHNINLVSGHAYLHTSVNIYPKVEVTKDNERSLRRFDIKKEVP